MKTQQQRNSLIQPKMRRFNVGVFERRTTVEIPTDALRLLTLKLPYQERHSKADILHKAASFLALANSLITLLVVLFAFIDNEVVYYEITTALQSAAIRFIIIALSLVQIILTVKGVQKQTELMIMLGHKHPNSNQYPASVVYDRRTRLWLIGEIAHLCVVMPPFIDFSVTISTYASEQSELALSDVITFLIVLRLYHVVRFIYSQSQYLLPKAQFYT